MYGEEATRVPQDEDDFWELLEIQFQFVRQILWETPVEDREAAMNQRFEQRSDGRVNKRTPMEAIRFRAGDPGYDNRDHFLEMGRELLPYIHWAIDTRQFTPRFVQEWGKIVLPRLRRVVLFRQQ